MTVSSDGKSMVAVSASGTQSMVKGAAQVTWKDAQGSIYLDDGSVWTKN